jgi:TIGR03009 family protein
MRPLGFTLTAALITTTAVWAQQPAQTGVPQAPPGVPATAPAANPTLDTHLVGWERTMSNVVNFRVEIELTKTDAAFKKDRRYKGVVLCMKPNYAILRLDNTGDPTKTDYLAFICNGKSVYEYNGNEKTITEYKLPPVMPNGGTGTDNLMLDFLSGLKAADAKQRFDISIFKEDDFYVYLTIKPLLPRDKQEFQQLKMALFGPKTKNLAYLPAQVYKVNPNGDTEEWKFTNQTTNLPGIAPNVFEYKKVAGFTERQAPTQPQPGFRPGQTAPGSTGLPPGPGAVRP